jgi:hypothetical protein
LNDYPVNITCRFTEAFVAHPANGRKVSPIYPYSPACLDAINTYYGQDGEQTPLR